MKIATFVIRFRALIIALFVIITIVLGYFLKDIKINADITTYLPKSDSVVARFNYIGHNYSSSSMAIIIVEAQKDVFSKETIEHINDLTNALKQSDGVDYVTSITNVVDIKKTEGGLEIGKLIDESNLPQTPEQLRNLKEYALSKTLYKGNLISENSKYTIIICRLNQDTDKNAAAIKIKEVVSAKHLPEKFYFEGMPFQLLSIMDYIKKDLLLLTPLIILLIAVTLFLSFRSWRGVVLPIISVGMGIIWSMGLMSIFDVELSPISDAIPVVLFAVGSAYGIHVYNRFKLRVNSKENKLKQSAEALKEVGIPVLLAGITTVMGFLSFVFGAYLNIISEFGIFSALGILFILIISLTFIPAIVSYLPPEKRKSTHRKEPKSGLLERFLSKLQFAILHHKKTVLIGSLVLVVVMIFGIPNIKNKIDILNYFRPETDIRVSASIMNKEFGGSLPIMIRVRGNIQDPATLSKMKQIQKFLESQPDVKNASSVADFIEEMNDCMGEGKQIPDSREKVSNLWFLMEGEEIMKQLVNSDKSEAVVQAYMKNVETKRYKELHASLNKFLDALNTPDCTFEQTGMPAIYSNFDDSLMKNLLQSMILSLVLIFGCMLLMLRSVKGALVGMIPLSFTIVIIFGMMGFIGIPLDIATILIASITVGAGIDYAIHFITEYKRLITLGEDIDGAITKTIQVSGKAITINVVTIILGFLILIFANLIPLVNFGILIAITMLFSGAGAITILPSVISLFKLKLVKETKK